ncbi:MAG: cob(I)yrinic acid a,c-diamide adenosyltransferase [Spirochaetes bacterium]|nr:cob(I)yrinic acid a,c-diamide adenosyltransferase [Spirochaetota bacterium]MBU1081900.1 cob(I)yrinic acid a,c-diamide adenosyltransferase [Spirochaetota bacterium]
MESGYLQVYTGNGKGKTTAAIGLCVRALGAGLDVYIGQFIKGMRYSEIAALEALSSALGPGRLVVEQYGRGCFIFRDPERADIDAAREGLSRARSALESGGFGLVILDELNVAVKVGVVAEADALALVAARRPGTELVVTGRYASDAMLAAADLVTEMREVKHYYREGVQARDGIER